MKNQTEASGNLFVMLGQLYAENQLLRQRIAFLEQQIAQNQQAQANGKEPEEEKKTKESVKNSG